MLLRVSNVFEQPPGGKMEVSMAEVQNQDINQLLKVRREKLSALQESISAMRVWNLKIRQMLRIMTIFWCSA